MAKVLGLISLLYLIWKIVIVASVGLGVAYNFPSGAGVLGAMKKDQCIMATEDELGRARDVHKDITVNANNDEKQSDGKTIKVEKGQRLSITTTGQIYLCQGTRPDHNDNAREIHFPANTNEWHATEVFARKGANITFTVTGNYSQFANDSCGNDRDPRYATYIDNTSEQRVISDISNATRAQSTGRWNDTDASENPCHATKGRGLYVYIGKDMPDTSTDLGSPEFSGPDDTFFELYDYRDEAQHPIGRTGEYHITAPESGKVYLRYAETPPENHDTDLNNDVFLWDTDAASYADNRGGYDVTIESKCLGINGEFLLGYIDSDGTPLNPVEESRIINLHAAAIDNLDPTSRLASSSVNGRTFFGDAPISGELTFQIIDIDNTDNTKPSTGDGVYSNNEGFYEVTVTLKETYNKLNFVDRILAPIRILLMGTDAPNNIDKIQSTHYYSNSSVGFGEDGIEFTTPEEENFSAVPSAPEMFFNAITANGKFILALQALLTLAIAWYGFQYVATGQGGSLQELIIFTLKLAVIIVLIDPKSWDFFYNYLFRVFVEGTEQVVVIMTQTAGAYSSSGAPPPEQGYAFGFLNEIIGLLVRLETFPRIIGLMNSSIFGVLIAFIIFTSILLFFKIVFHAFLVYAAAMIFTAILLSVAPIFITFLLFARTKHFFDQWLRALVAFALQPIFLLSLLSMLSIILYSLFIQLLFRHVCFECIFSTSAVPGLRNIPGAADFCLFANWQWWTEHDGNALQDLNLALVLLFVAYSFSKLPQFVTSAAGYIAEFMGADILTTLKKAIKKYTK